MIMMSGSSTIGSGRASVVGACVGIDSGITSATGAGGLPDRPNSSSRNLHPWSELAITRIRASLASSMLMTDVPGDECIFNATCCVGIDDIHAIQRILLQSYVN